jgi:hypothetical protein
MEPSKAAMKAALRVLTALSERREPDQADVDELHWFAPADRARPIDELVCEAIQRAIQAREEKRKAVRAQLRERTLALGSAEAVQQSEMHPASRSQPAREIETLIREHASRRQEYLALNAKLNRLGIALQQVTASIIAPNAENCSANSEVARGALDSVAREVDVTGIARLLEEHVRLTRLLTADVQALKAYGIR